jgi:aspartyl-tRNA(Asn)/glutamyl-tRNA(Gln) amidotransferase subunit B
MTAYETVIGLEIHVQLATRSKLFSGASTQFGAAPNSQACPVDLGLPGVLPVLNEAAVRMAVTFGLAIGANIGRRCTFDRKNYFYPDLPKGYQITQLEHPIVERGKIDFTLPDGTPRSLTIHHAHLEEDAGKSIHDQFPGQSGIDLNRAGTPLLEIVTEPELRSAEEAVAFLKRLHALVRYLGISDGNMNEGSFRCDVNLSLRPFGQAEFGERTETKNINSFRFVERAIAVETDRQESLLRHGKRVLRETMLYDEQHDETRPMRSKEYADDYRYFPEPDLLPLQLSEAFVAEVQAALPELADAKRARFQREFALSDYDADYLTTDRALADYFETAACTGGDAKLAANWVMGEIAAWLNREAREIDAFPIDAARIGTLVARVKDGTLSSRTAKTLFDALLTDGGDIDALIEAKNLKQVSDAGALDALVAQVIAANRKQVEDYRASDAEKRKKKLGFFVGAVMKSSGGKANPQEVNERLTKALDEA